MGGFEFFNSVGYNQICQESGKNRGQNEWTPYRVIGMGSARPCQRLPPPVTLLLPTPPGVPLLLPLQEKGFHSLVFLSFSVLRNITVLYSSVLEPMNNPQPTNIATYIHHRRLTDECIRIP
jgi:hypothetical protein